MINFILYEGQTIFSTEIKQKDVACFKRQQETSI